MTREFGAALVTAEQSTQQEPARWLESYHSPEGQIPPGHPPAAGGGGVDPDAAVHFKICSIFDSSRFPVGFSKDEDQPTIPTPPLIVHFSEFSISVGRVSSVEGIAPPPPDKAVVLASA